MSRTTPREKAAEIFHAFIKAKGMRHTAERNAILDVVCRIPGHFDIDALRHELRARGSISVSRATLYNTLNLLAEAGLICVHHFEDRPTLYEFAYGTTGRNHLLCTECGRILPFENEALDAVLDRLAPPGFHPTGHSVEVYGLCDRCMHRPSGPVHHRETNITTHTDNDKR